MKRLPVWALLLGLSIAYSPMFMGRIIGMLGIQAPWLSGPPSVLLVNWLAVAGVFAFIWCYEKRTLASIRLVRPRLGDIGWALAFWIIGVVVSALVHQFLPPPPSDGMDTILALSIPVLIAIVATASITEEILYRGYSIERLTELAGNRWLAVAASFVLFIAPHIVFFGPHWLLYHGVTVILIYILYLWRRNLWACMLMHLLGNLMILIPALGLA